MVKNLRPLRPTPGSGSDSGYPTLQPVTKSGSSPKWIFLVVGIFLSLALVLVLVVLILPRLSNSVSGKNSSVPLSPIAITGKETPTEIRQILSALPVKGKASKSGYSREAFGTAWADVDHNGCDTRNDILIRDLTQIRFKRGRGNCVVAAGKLDDPYTGRTIIFTRGSQTSQEVQIDHIVSLHNAWQTGAQQLSLSQRTQLANDPLNLLAVDGPTNQGKSDGDAATWLPPNRRFRCTYAIRQVQVKAKYGLWLSAAEKQALTNLLAAC